MSDQNQEQAVNGTQEEEITTPAVPVEAEAAATEGAVESAEPVAALPAADEAEALPAPEAEESTVDALQDAVSEAVDQVQETVEAVAESAVEAASEMVQAIVDEPAEEPAAEATTEDEAPAVVEATAEAEAPATVAEGAAEDADEDEATAESTTEDEATAEATTEDEAEGEAEADGEKKKRRRKRGGGKARRPLESFEVGEEIKGKVRSLQPYGAFVDVQAERDGLVHISELRDGFVEKVEDVVKEGEEVTVRVKEVDTEKGRLSLTMRSAQSLAEEQQKEQDRDKRLRLRDLTDGQEILGTVTSIVDFGAFVDIGATTDGLIHISELSEDRVNRVEDVVSVGQEVKVRVLNVDRKRNRISLTMRENINIEDYSYESDEVEELPSVMELAFERARERSKKDRRRSKKGGAGQDREIDDIIRRTLDQHGDK